MVTLLVGAGIGFGVGSATNSDDTDQAAIATNVESDTTVPAVTETDDSPDTTESDATSAPNTASPPADTATTETSDDTTTPPAPGNGTPAAPDASAFVTAFGGAEAIALPPGEPGRLSVIAMGPPDSSQSLPVLVRNMTSETFGRIAFSGVARDASGALVGSGEDQGVQPGIVGPGEIAWGYVYFGIDLPADTVYDITADGEPQSDDTFGGKLPLEITEVNVSQDTIVGIASNTGTTKASGPISVSVLCLSPDGTELRERSDYATGDDLEPGGTSAFTVNFYGDPVCGQFLVAASGYDF